GAVAWAPATSGARNGEVRAAAAADANECLAHRPLERYVHRPPARWFEPGAQEACVGERPGPSCVRQRAVVVVGLRIAGPYDVGGEEGLDVLRAVDADDEVLH